MYRNDRNYPVARNSVLALLLKAVYDTCVLPMSRYCLKCLGGNVLFLFLCFDFLNVVHAGNMWKPYLLDLCWNV